MDPRRDLTRGDPFSLHEAEVVPVDIGEADRAGAAVVAGEARPR